jgi:RNA polymerase sigma-70 factor, ECF subfamily
MVISDYKSILFKICIMDATINRLPKGKLKKIKDDLTVAHGEYKDVLLRRAQYKTNDDELSQDLVQTTFLKTLIYLRKGGQIDLMHSFLNHVLSALIIDEYRKNAKHKSLSMDVLLDKGFDPGSNEYKRNADIFDGKKIVSLIPQLPKKYELVIHMRYSRGLSLREMALLTGQSENTVAVQVHRGLLKLRELYFST